MNGLPRNARAILAALSLLAVPVIGHCVPTFEFGVSTSYTVLPGSRVDVTAYLHNTGDDTLFMPSVSAGVARGVGNEWQIIESWSWAPIHTQFDQLTLHPGNLFEFSFGSFAAPDLPIGTVSTADLSFQFQYGDIFAGTVADGTNLPGYSQSINLTAAIGESAGASRTEFFLLCTVDRSSGTPLSGPPGCVDSVSVPEPGTMPLLSLALGGFLISWRRAHRRGR
jgi:hypothetical protein